MKASVIFLILAGLVVSGFYMAHSPQPYNFPYLMYFPPMPESAENPLTVEGVKLGRMLFYDPVLSRDSTFSCASCHKQEYAFSGGPVEFNTGIDGKKLARNTPPLFNLAWYPGMFWDGRAKTLEEQVLHPVQAHDEMDLAWGVAVQRLRDHPRYPGLFAKAFGNDRIDSTRVAYAIAQFERTLISNRSKFDLVIQGKARLTRDEYEGLLLINNQTKANCLHCHSSDADALGTTLIYSNNGLDAAIRPEDYADPGLGGISGKASDMGKFRVPSLRNVALTAPYMHDGRFNTLEEVLDFYSEGIQPGVNTDARIHNARLSAVEKRQIIAFLHTLTDSAFVAEKEFGEL